MTISTNYYRLSDDPTRASTLSTFGSAGSGVFAAGTYGPTALVAYAMPLATNTISSLATTGTIDYVGNVFAFSDTQNASAAYTVASSGSISHYVGLNPGVLNNLAVSLNLLTSGTSTASGIFVMDYTGALANYQSTWASVSANAIGGTAPYRWLTHDSSNNLYAIGQKDVHKFALSSPTSGTWSTFSAPNSSSQLLLDCLILNGSNPIVAGRIPTLNSDIATQVLQTSTQILSIDQSAHQFTVSVFTATNTISTAQTVTASGSPTYGAISLNQLLITDATNGTVRVFNNTGGTWSGPIQTLSLTNAARIGTSPDGSIAIVCQTASGSAQAYSESGGVWTAENSVAISGAIDVSIVSDTFAYVAGASGIVQLSYTSNWSISNTYSVGISTSSVVANPSNTNFVYACGTSGGSGFAFSINTSANTYTSASWNGGAKKICYVNGYICVLDDTNSVIRILMANNSTIAYAASAALIPATYTDLTAGTQNLAFASGSSGWLIMQQAYPFQMENFYSSYIWQYTGAAWNAYNCGYPQIAAICTDGTYVYGVRIDNQLFKLNTSAALQSGYPQVVPAYSGQTATAYLGISNMLILNGNIYFSSSEGGAIGEITGL